MSRVFNVSADCKPGLHYMVNLEERLAAIKSMVDRGDYFTINRARQYGKTTTLKALGRYLWNDYEVLSLDFQKLSHADFETEFFFTEALSREILKKLSYKNKAPKEIKEQLEKFTENANGKAKLADLFHCFNRWCEISDKPVVLMIDEVDSAANHQVFLDFLALLRAYYIDRDEIPTFWSVILAGVYDIKNLKSKLVSDDANKRNSPWNIAADFLIDMSFSAEEIAVMLIEYESDHNTGMDVEEISNFIYDYTSGYPFLVSRFCKLMDERIAGNWTKSEALEAVKILLTEKNTLFESLVGKITEYPKLHDLMYELLFNGTSIPYNPLDSVIETAEMFGIIKNCSGNAIVANRIFETIFYNYFLSEEAINSKISKAALYDKSQFIRNGHLDMERNIIFLKNGYINNQEIGQYFKKIDKKFTKIQIDEKKLNGMPVIKNTRIPVSLIVACLKDEMTFLEICEEYKLTQEDIEEAMEYVIEILDVPYQERSE